MEVLRLKDQPLQSQKVTVKYGQRCRKFVRDPENEMQKEDPRYLFEKYLRDDQLSTVLRALLLMEAKLKREQKRITQQLYQKDFIIQKQKEDIKKILYSQYCKKCSCLYNPGFHLEDSEYSPTSQNDNLSSFIVDNDRIPPFSDRNLNSNISSSSGSSCDELLHHGSDVECTNIKLENSNAPDGSLSVFAGDDRTAFLPDKEISSITNFHSDSSCEDSEIHAPINEYPYHHNERIKSLRDNLSLENSNSSCGSFQPRSNSLSTFSDEENTSDDYDNLESLPTEILGDELSVKSLDSEKVCSEESFDKSSNHYNVDSTSLSFSESNITVIRNIPLVTKRSEVVENPYKSELEESCPENKLPPSSLQFDLELDSNEKWYFSASDHEDEQEKNIYKNNPVLECVNQILLQNIDTEYDSLNCSNKSTYVYNEVDSNDKNKVNSEHLALNRKHTGNETNLRELHNNYYETPIQEPPNFYETPVSVYSNDYEQIRSKCSDTLSQDSLQFSKKEGNTQKKHDFERKYKILRTPPSLPPKPVNLVSKYRIQYNPLKLINEKLSDRISLDSEPDYCSISELNLPTNRLIIPDKTQVIAEIHATNEGHGNFSPKLNHYDFVEPQKNHRLIEQTNEMEQQNYKTMKISYDSPNSSLSKNIPKLPSVSEIIIPEEADKKVNTHYNLTKNSPQVHKTKISSSNRKPIKIGSSVSALIMDFNNKELLYEINKKALTTTRKKEILSPSSNACIGSEANNEDCLIQNFEEFKLDDCELQEFSERTDELGGSESEIETARLNIDNQLNAFKNTTELRTLAEEVADINLTSLNLNDFIGKLELCNNRSRQLIKDVPSYNWKDESTYEDFLECTGLSSKSILTSSQLTNTTNHKNIDAK